MINTNKNILVSVAWPYANGRIHIGHLAGCYLPADIFARFNRMIGNNVLMVSGSDAHGTPVVISALQENKSPQELFEYYDKDINQSWSNLRINFDLFTSTRTQNHEKVVQDIFLDLLDKGFIYSKEMTLPYCSDCERFLADRYVEGTCPNKECNSKDARGDQCDSCGKTLDPKDLLDMVCKICLKSEVINFRNSEHYFLKLSSFENKLKDWLNSKNNFKSNVQKTSLGFMSEGLNDRPITRDIDWGIKVPVDGWEDKRIYVWFEAVIGYLSASIEYFSDKQNKDQWKEYWQGESESYYFMGKDNIIFHSVILPAILLGKGELNLPHNIPANEYLNLEGKQLSTSRNWALWANELSEIYETDTIRYSLASNLPESSDTNFSLTELIRSNNQELVAAYGNLVNRVVNICVKNFNSVIPDAKNIDDDGKEIISLCNSTMSNVKNEISKVRIRSGLREIMKLCSNINKYIDQKEPWKLVKTDKEKAGEVIWVCLTAINCLKVLFYAYIPDSSDKLNTMLGFEDNSEFKWEWDEYDLPPGQSLNFTGPLFKKIED
ncbi:MAG: methionine--tRNA ligase [Dehalococcoidia bacterium]